MSVESGSDSEGHDIYDELIINKAAKKRKKKNKRARQAETEETPAPKGVALYDEDTDALRAFKVQNRGPRYFDTEQDETLRLATALRCFKCGKPGHMARECTGQATLKPCTLCAQFGHISADCPDRICFKCGRMGHMSRDCPYGFKEKQWESPDNTCLRCGSRDCPAAHKDDYFRFEGGCSQRYDDADLAHAKCFICGKMGHLSCREAPSDITPASCYLCGASGHTAQNCGSELPAHLRGERMADEKAERRRMDTDRMSAMRGSLRPTQDAWGGGGDRWGAPSRAWQPDDMRIMGLHPPGGGDYGFQRAHDGGRRHWGSERAVDRGYGGGGDSTPYRERRGSDSYRHEEQGERRRYR